MRKHFSLELMEEVPIVFFILDFLLYTISRRTILENLTKMSVSYKCSIIFQYFLNEQVLGLT